MTPSVPAARLAARHLKSLLWGQPEGPRRYDELPSDLRPVALAVDQMGNDLAQARIALFAPDDDPDDLIMQVQMLAHVAARQVLPDDLDDIPDPCAVWTRRDIEGDRFDSAALDGALYFLAMGGEPNGWRDGELVGQPSLKDVRAMQNFAFTLTDATVGFEVAGVTPTLLLEDFVRMHWSNDPDNPDHGGLTHYWEDTHVGHALFAAVRSSKHVPAEEAAFVPSPPTIFPPEGGWTPGR